MTFSSKRVVHYANKVTEVAYFSYSLGYECISKLGMLIVG